jgi:hypothetical protein
MNPGSSLHSLSYPDGDGLRIFLEGQGNSERGMSQARTGNYNVLVRPGIPISRLKLHYLKG